MAPRMILRDGEVRIITVTPVARAPFGRAWPPSLWSLSCRRREARALDTRARDGAGAHLRRPFGLVALTRTWRWRSHKVHVTNERIVVEGGVFAPPTQHG